MHCAELRYNGIPTCSWSTFNGADTHFTVVFSQSIKIESDTITCSCHIYTVLFGTYINTNTKKKMTHLSLLAPISGLVWRFHFRNDRQSASFLYRIQFTYADTSNCNRVLTCKSFPNKGQIKIADWERSRGSPLRQGRRTSLC